LLAGAIVDHLPKYFPEGTDDQTWPALAGSRAWVVLTRDKRIGIASHHRPFT
jgi:hypothetical protein